MGKLKSYYHDQLVEQNYEPDWEDYVNSEEEEWWEHEDCDEDTPDGERSEVEE